MCVALSCIESCFHSLRTGLQQPVKEARVGMKPGEAGIPHGGLSVPIQDFAHRDLERPSTSSEPDIMRRSQLLEAVDVNLDERRDGRGSVERQVGDFLRFPPLLIAWISAKESHDWLVDDTTQFISDLYINMCPRTESTKPAYSMDA